MCSKAGEEYFFSIHWSKHTQNFNFSLQLCFPSMCQVSLKLEPEVETSRNRTWKNTVKTCLANTVLICEPGHVNFHGTPWKLLSSHAQFHRKQTSQEMTATVHTKFFSRNDVILGQQAILKIHKLMNYSFLQAHIREFLWLEYNRIQQNMCLLLYKHVNSYGWSTFWYSVHLNANKSQMQLSIHILVLSACSSIPFHSKTKQKKNDKKHLGITPGFWDLWPHQKDPCFALV